MLYRRRSRWDRGTYIVNEGANPDDIVVGNDDDDDLFKPFDKDDKLPPPPMLASTEIMLGSKFVATDYSDKFVTQGPDKWAPAFSVSGDEYSLEV